jgi:hypothetical protein
MLKSLPKERAVKPTLKADITGKEDLLVSRGFGSHRHRELQMAMEILPKLDLTAFLERCVLGDYAGFTEPEKILRTALEELNLHPVRVKKQEDLQTERFKTMQKRKNRLKTVLRVIKNVVELHHAAYPDVLSHYGNSLSSFKGEVDREYAHFNVLMKKQQTQKAEADLLELYEKNPCTWFFVHVALEERGIRPNYSNVDSTLSGKASTPPS